MTVVMLIVMMIMMTVMTLTMVKICNDDVDDDDSDDADDHGDNSTYFFRLLVHNFAEHSGFTTRMMGQRIIKENAIKAKKSWALG